MTGIDDAVQRTIEYARRYGQELSAKQIAERLIGEKVWGEEAIRKKIYDLGFMIYEKKNKDYVKKIEKARKLAENIGKVFGDILFVGVTGSVAAENPKKEDDIDLMIITKTNALWKTRFLLRIYIWFSRIPHRNYGQKQKGDDFCFNLWLDEEALGLPGEKQKLRSAVDMILMKPVLCRNSVYAEFIKANRWVKKYAATPYANRLSDCQTFSFSEVKTRNNRFSEWLNKVFFWPQWWWMRRKISKEIVDLHRAYFHKN